MYCNIAMAGASKDAVTMQKEGPLKNQYLDLGLGPLVLRSTKTGGVV